LKSVVHGLESVVHFKNIVHGLDVCAREIYGNFLKFPDNHPPILLSRILIILHPAEAA
jgi:hypothetical protein